MIAAVPFRPNGPAWIVSAAIVCAALWGSTGCRSTPPAENQPQPGAASAQAVEPTDRHDKSDARQQHKLVKTAVVDDGVTFRFELPDDAVDDSVSVTVELEPSSPLLNVAGFRYGMMNPTPLMATGSPMWLTPYTNIPNALIVRRLQSAGPDKWSEGPEDHARVSEQAERLLPHGHQKLVRHQRDSGGFAWDDGHPTALATALGLLQLAGFDKVGQFDVSKPKRRAANWLATHQHDKGYWASDPTARLEEHPSHVARLRQTAFAVWALRWAASGDEHDQTIYRGLAALEKLLEADGLEPYDRALAANVLLANGRRKRAVALLDELAQQVSKDGELRYWEQDLPTWSGLDRGEPAISATALAIGAMALADVYPELIPGGLAYLDENAREWKHVRTDASIWVTAALLAIYQPGAWTPATLEVRAAGEPMSRAAGEVVDKVDFDPKAKETTTLHGPLDSGQPVVTITPDHPSSAIATATVTFEVPEARRR